LCHFTTFSLSPYQLPVKIGHIFFPRAEIDFEFNDVDAFIKFNRVINAAFAGDIFGSNIQTEAGEDGLQIVLGIATTYLFSPLSSGGASLVAT